MTKASEDFLGAIHGLVAEQIKALLVSENPEDVRSGLNFALKYLKDNNITAAIESSEPMADLSKMLPSAQELEKLMTMTPD